MRRGYVPLQVRVPVVSGGFLDCCPLADGGQIRGQRVAKSKSSCYRTGSVSAAMRSDSVQPMRLLCLSKLTNAIGGMTMRTYDDSVIVTEDNIEEVRDGMGNSMDQRGELQPGCVIWSIWAGVEVGRMTTWPNGRGAVCWNADSSWGEWDEDERRLYLDDGGSVDEDGEFMDEDEEGVDEDR